MISFTDPAALTPEKSRRYPLLDDSQRPHNLEKEKFIFPYPGIEPRFLCSPACSLVTIPTGLNLSISQHQYIVANSEHDITYVLIQGQIYSSTVKVTATVRSKMCTLLKNRHGITRLISFLAHCVCIDCHVVTPSTDVLQRALYLKVSLSAHTHTHKICGD